MSNLIKVDFVGPVAEGHGMGVQCRNLIRVLKGECDLKVFGFNPQTISGRLSSNEITYLMQSSAGAERVPDISIQYVLPPMFQPRSDAYNIGVISWETSKLPCRDIDLRNGIHPVINNWVKQIDRMDEIWTFSENAAGAIRKSGYKKPVIVIPGPIDTDFWSPSAPKIDRGIVGVTVDHRGQPINDKFVVGYVADWNERKDIETFIACTSLALPPQNSVIVLKTKNYITQEKPSELVATIKRRLIIDNLPPIVVIDEDLTPEDERGLLQTFHVYACTSRGEGLNLPALEAMSMAKPVVLPAHSAHLDYIEQGKNGNLIGVNLEICRTAVKNPWYQNDQVWGKVNEVQYLQCLQSLHREWAEGRLKANNAGRKTVESRYSDKVCAASINNRLKAIRDGLAPQRIEADKPFKTVPEVHAVPD